MIRSTHRSSRGFTLLELVVVVAIVGVVAMMVASSLQRTKERQSIVANALDLRARIERVRGLALEAGSRLGTPRIVLGPGCPSPVTGNNTVDLNLWVQINPATGNVVAPSTITETAPGSDLFRVNCVTFIVGAGDSAYSQAAPTMAANPLAAGILLFGFSSGGRLVRPPGVGALPFVQLTEPRGRLTRGFRVLSSGTVCDATTLGLGANSPCDT